MARSIGPPNCDDHEFIDRYVTGRLPTAGATANATTMGATVASSAYKRHINDCPRKGKGNLGLVAILQFMSTSGH